MAAAPPRHGRGRIGVARALNSARCSDNIACRYHRLTGDRGPPAMLRRPQASAGTSRSMEYKDYYKILGVERDATQDDIKRAYRKLARTLHPDINKESGAEAKFKELGEAYEVLKDPEKRAAYNELGANWKQGQDFRPPPNWDQGFEFSGGGYTQCRLCAVQRFLRGAVRTGAAGAAARGGFVGAVASTRQGRGPPRQSRHRPCATPTSAPSATSPCASRKSTTAGHVVVKDRTLERHHPEGRARGPAHPSRRPGLARHGQGPARRSLSRSSRSRPIRCSRSKAKTSISSCR